jgi:hydrocephalus-inducing protein
LNPNEEKNVIVRFKSQKEIKLNTTVDKTDIFLNILEGKSQEIHN